jgi:hypothetical protein
MQVRTSKEIHFPNDSKVKEYKLTQHGKEHFVGTYDHCLIKLQRLQSQSASWAMRHDGWKIEPTGKEMDDPRIRVKVLEDVKWTNRTILFEYRGNRYRIDKNAAYGYGTFEAGQMVDVDSAYAYPAED